MNFSFQLIRQDGAARRGKIHTAHGEIDTPAFMPVGTAATVKGMLPQNLRALGAQIILANTYHLMLRPGGDALEKLGGLHRFMNWPGPVLTDSGGYQVMSLAGLRDLDETGVTFRSHLDGSRHQLTPERAVQLQHQYDSTITMVLDECTPYPSTYDAARSSMERSMRWAERCKNAFVARAGYGVFGIVQGSIFPDQRAQSALKLAEIGFDGYAIGGLAVGEGQAQMFAMIEATMPYLPPGRPRYLMGVGKPLDLLGAVARGVDMFDCVLPTRSGRTGQAFTRFGTVNLRNAVHQGDDSPLDRECLCPACRDYSRAYLHHLVRSNEILASVLLTWHNLAFYQQIMAAMRDAIAVGQFADFASKFTEDYETKEREAAANPKPTRRKRSNTPNTVPSVSGKIAAS
ncbi:MAG: tRNA guanosine(34) transglycosylase Tgt [Candidatus Symbiobacter sp.]|nr:tRNA guanosine(34) transglycosylase Tgt [Candidatus Symbiobacter sp.]